jgi:hypothetical protein
MARFSAITSASNRRIPPFGRERGQLLEQAGCGPTAVEIVRDRERHLGCARLAQTVVTGYGDQAVAVACDQGDAFDAVRLHVLTRHEVNAAVAVKAQVATLRGELLEEALDVLEILRRGSPQAQRRAITQKHVTDQLPVAHKGRRQGVRLPAS